jgi:hypothetical protein
MVVAQTTLLLNFNEGQQWEGNLKVIELKPSDFPLEVRLLLAGGPKQYVLVKTRQDKLLLNKSLENPPGK